jgi:multidrug resistance efflux pump
VSRPVEVGDVVAPGSPLFELVDMNRLYVKVFVPEPEVGKLRLGAAAEVSGATVRAVLTPRRRQPLTRQP